jgi:hypothetical protein
VNRSSSHNDSSTLSQQKVTIDDEQLPSVPKPKPRKLTPWMKYAQQSQFLLKGSTPIVPPHLPIKTTYHKQEGPEFCHGIVVDDENSEVVGDCQNRSYASTSNQQYEQQAELRNLAAQCMACKSKLIVPFTTQLIMCPKCNTVSPFLSYRNNVDISRDK